MSNLHYYKLINSAYIKFGSMIEQVEKEIQASILTWGYSKK